MSGIEKLNANPEKERSPELESINKERSEVLREQLEHAEASHEKLSDVRNDAIEIAAQSDEERAKESEDRANRSPAERRAPKRKQLDASFDNQMSHIRDDMTPTSRNFSKVIHNKAVESVSEGLGATIARPNALLAGSIAAFIVVTVLYLVAKNYGYQLSGFETIAAFAGGWIVGILYDYLRVMITGKKQQ